MKLFDSMKDPDVCEFIQNEKETPICGYCGENIAPQDILLFAREDGEVFFIHKQHLDNQDDARA